MVYQIAGCTKETGPKALRPEELLAMYGGSFDSWILLCESGGAAAQQQQQQRARESGQSTESSPWPERRARAPLLTPPHSAAAAIFPSYGRASEPLIVQAPRSEKNSSCMFIKEGAHSEAALPVPYFVVNVAPLLGEQDEAIATSSAARSDSLSSRGSSKAE